MEDSVHKIVEGIASKNDIHKSATLANSKPLVEDQKSFQQFYPFLKLYLYYFE